MADTGARVVGPVLLTGAAATLYTVPPLTTLNMLNIHVFNNDTSTRDLTLSIGADAAGTRLYDAFVIPAKGTLDWTGFMVVTAGEILQAFGSTTLKLNITISGVLVT